MTTERLDIRLDPERRRKLRDIAERRKVSASRLMRDAIDLLYEAEMRAQRMAAVEAIGRMQIEDLPDPEELSRELDRTYDTPLP